MTQPEDTGSVQGETTLPSLGIYARVSTPGQGDSIESQLQRCKGKLSSLGHSHAEIEAAQVYVDHGYSGKDTDRPSFQRMMRDARLGRVRVLVFTELSRVSRSLMDAIRVINDFEILRIEWISLRENCDTTTPYGRFAVTLILALGQLEREQTAERTRANMRARSQRGLFNGGHVPFGYMLDPDRRGHLVPDSETSEMVRAIFETYRSVGSIPRVLEDIKSRGWRRPAKAFANGTRRAEQDFTWGSVRGLLRNPVYVGRRGVNTRNRDLSEAQQAELAEDDRYTTVEAVWEGIVEEDLFDEVQGLLAENYRRKGNVLAARDHDFYLSRLVRCGKCGHTLEGESAKSGRHLYYRHPRRANTDGCPKKRWKAPTLEAAVIERIQRLVTEPPLLAAVVAAANAKAENREPALRAAVSEATGARQALEVQQDDMTKKLASMPADDVPSFFWDKARQLDAQTRHARRVERDAQQALEDASHSRHDVKVYRQQLERFAEVFAVLDPKERKTLVGALIDAIHLNGDKVQVTFAGNEEPGGAVNQRTAGFGDTSTWLRRQDSNLRPGG